MSDSDPRGGGWQPQQPSQPTPPTGGWGAHQPPSGPGGHPPPPGGSGYPGGYPTPQPGWYPPAPPPNHPSATPALVFGIVSLVGGITCCIPAFAAPFAWYLGTKAEREIRQEPGRWSGEGLASTGKILGIIGTILLVVGVLAVGAFIALGVVAESNNW